jgi:CHAD domain-containing protein
MAFRLHRGENPGHGLMRCLRQQLAAAERALGLPGVAPTDGVIHQARRRLKKCRALLRLLAGGDAERDAIRSSSLKLRDAGRVLSGSRDARVAVVAFRRLPHRKAFAPLEQALARQDTANPAGPVREAVEFIRAERARQQDALACRLTDRELARGLAKLERRAGKSASRWHADHDPVRLHEWRKRVKDLYYALKFARPACRAESKRLIGRLRELGKIMGRRLDIEVLVRVAAARANPMPGQFTGVIDAERRRLDRAVNKAAKGLVEARSGARPTGLRA